MFCLQQNIPAYKLILYEAGREAKASSEEEVARWIIWFLHVFLRLALKEKTARLRTLDLFLFSVEKVRKHLLSCVREKVTKTRPFYQSQLSRCLPPPLLSPEDTKGSSFRNVAFFSEHYMTGKMQKLSTDREMIPVGRKRGWGRGYKRVYSTATGRNYRLFFYFKGADPAVTEITKKRMIIQINYILSEPLYMFHHQVNTDFGSYRQ